MVDAESTPTQGNKQMMDLATIVKERNLPALEAYFLGRTYSQVRADAVRLGVNLEELEELLWDIS
jgi:hypothetical protein